MSQIEEFYKQNSIKIEIQDLKNIEISCKNQDTKQILISIVKSLNGYISKKNQKISLNINQYDLFKKKIQKTLQNCVFDDIPDFVWRYLNNQKDFQLIPPILTTQQLQLNQREFIQFYQKNEKKVLLIQNDRSQNALLAANKCNIGKQILIITKKQWIENWISLCQDQLQIDISDIFVVESHIVENRKYQVVISSYENSLLINLCLFKVAILDEIQILKNTQSQKSKYLLPSLQNYESVIMCSDSQSFKKPIQYVNIFRLKNSEIFGSFNDFTQRYCSPQPSKFYQGIDYSGFDCKNEFFTILNSFSITIENNWDNKPIINKKKIKKMKNPNQKSIKQYLIPQKENSQILSNDLIDQLKELCQNNQEIQQDRQINQQSQQFICLSQNLSDQKQIISNILLNITENSFEKLDQIRSQLELVDNQLIIEQSQSNIFQENQLYKKLIENELSCNSKIFTLNSQLNCQNLQQLSDQKQFSQETNQLKNQKITQQIQKNIEQNDEIQKINETQLKINLLSEQKKYYPELQTIFKKQKPPQNLGRYRKIC